MKRRHQHKETMWKKRLSPKIARLRQNLSRVELIEKVLTRGLATKSEKISLPDESINQVLREGRGYKYLCILEASGVLDDQMKKNISKETLRRFRKTEGTNSNKINSCVDFE